MKRKKIGLVTITEGCNYGNRLQNYATQTLLKNLGCNVETLKCYSADTLSSEIYQLHGISKAKFFIKNFLNFNTSKYEQRIYRFDRFNKKYIKMRKKPVINDDVDEKISKEYDYFLCGSDQVWNPIFKINSENKYLSFVEKKDKISIAASFGVEEIPQNNIRRIAELLNQFKAISVREESGKKIVEELTNKKAQVVIDPVLALGEEQWSKIESSPLKINNGLISCYLLGNYDNNIIESIYEYANDIGKDLIFFENEYSIEREYSHKHYDLDPSHFVWAMHHCDKIITDSFHAVILALVFKKPFIMLKRPIEGYGDMSSRFRQLANMFNIKEYYADNGNLGANAVVNYEEARKIIKQKRKELIAFLQRSLID